MPKLKVYTAVDTMLYSPVFLALCVEPALRHHVELRSVASKAADVDQLLRSVGDLGEWAIGVGDPMRLTAFSHPEEFDVLGVLIDKMCFWVVDHDYDGEWFSMDKFVVHPRGMTAFTVAAHQLAKRCRLKLDSSDINEVHDAIEKINDKLYDHNVDPNNEFETYRSLKEGGAAADGRRGVAPGVNAAFITANPLLHQSNPGHGLRNLYCFMKDYSDVVMTALIGRKQAKKHERELRGEFVKVVAYACGKIKSDPAFCAELLWNSWSKVHPSHETSPAGYATPEDLAESLAVLGEKEIYNQDAALLVPWANVERTCDIRSYIEPLLRKDQRQSSVGDVCKLLEACVRP